MGTEQVILERPITIHFHFGLLLLLILPTDIAVHGFPDGAQVALVERPHSLPILGNTHGEHQPCRREHRPAGGGECFVEDGGGAEDLREELENLLLPEPVIVDGVGSDGVRAADMEQQQRRPQRHQLLPIRRPGADGEVAKAECRGEDGQLVRDPDNAPKNTA